MAATQLLVLPTSVMQAGHVYGPFPTPQVNAQFSAYSLTFQQMGSWPTVGQVLTFTIERSQDGGQSWQLDASSDVGPAPWTDRSGNTVTTGGLTVGMGTISGAQQATALTDLFRVTITCLQNCAAQMAFVGIP